MSDIGSMVPESLRTDLRKKFARAPEPVGSRADECADIAFHAIGEAVKALGRVTEASPPELALPVVTISIGVAGTVFKEMETALMGAIVERLFRPRASGAQT
ncbi:hypothetical protein [Sphingopyxis sp.]|jgi:hypothetical protein|uniref:hypothetical protein n=1 Tax=Sphingopyxis sp. TaxID=1908224 RepID=UPI003F6FF8CF